MVGVIIIIMVVFDAQAAARAAVRAFVRPARSRARVIAAIYRPRPAGRATRVAAEDPAETQKGRPKATPAWSDFRLERAKRFELSTPTLARLCSTTELRPHSATAPAGRSVSSRGGDIPSGFAACKRFRKTNAIFLTPARFHGSGGVKPGS